MWPKRPRIVCLLCPGVCVCVRAWVVGAHKQKEISRSHTSHYNIKLLLPTISAIWLHLEDIIIRISNGKLIELNFKRALTGVGCHYGACVLPYAAYV